METRALVPITAESGLRVIDAEFEEASSDVRAQLRFLFKYRKLAATCFAATLSLVILFVLLTPRSYTSSAKIFISKQSAIQLRLQDNVLRVGEGDTGNVRDNFNATQVASLQSRDLAGRVIRENRLATDARFLSPTTFTGWVISYLPSFGKAPADSPATASTVDPRLIDRYIGLLNVQSVRGTDLIEVDFTTADPEFSAFLVRAHLQAFIKMTQEARRQTDSTATTFFADQIRESQKRVDAAEATLHDFAIQHPNVAVNQEQNSIAQRINELSTLLTAAEAEHVTLQSRRDFLLSTGTDAMPYFLDKPGVEKLRMGLLELRGQIAGEAQRLGPEHPSMRGLVEQETELKGQLRNEVKNELDSVRAKLGAAELREQRLHTQLSSLENSAIGLRELGVRYDVLKTNLQTARTLHDSLLKQQLDTAVNSDLAPTDVRMIETPEVPHSPSQPWVFLDLLLGILASSLVALGAVVARSHFDSSVATSEEVEEFLQLPTLAAIPNFARAGIGTGNGVSAEGRLRSSDGDTEVVFLKEPWSQIAEAFRMMKTAVLFSASGTRTTPKVILVTSALPGEGKTVGSLNLAAALAEAGARVLLIDADLRHASCHTALGVSNDRGLSALLMGKASPEDVVQPLKTPRLSFVPAGRRPANRAELVSAGELRAAFATWRTEFNFIVVDTPPALTASDAVELAQYADGVVIVVKGDDTPRALVRRVRDKLTRAGAQVLGVVLNNVGRGAHEIYNYGDETGTASSHQEKTA